MPSLSRCRLHLRRVNIHLILVDILVLFYFSPAAQSNTQSHHLCVRLSPSDSPVALFGCGVLSSLAMTTRKAYTSKAYPLDVPNLPPGNLLVSDSHEKLPTLDTSPSLLRASPDPQFLHVEVTSLDTVK